MSNGKIKLTNTDYTAVDTVFTIIGIFFVLVIVLGIYSGVTDYNQLLLILAFGSIFLAIGITGKRHQVLVDQNSAIIALLQNQDDS